MAHKDPRDPRGFICRAEAPSFDLETQDWDMHLFKWRIFLGKSGITTLYDADPAAAPNADVTRQMATQKAYLTANAFMSGLTDSSLRVIMSAVPQDEQDNVDNLIKALNDHIRGGTNTAVYRRDLASSTRPHDMTFNNWIVLLRDLAHKCGFKAVTAPEHLEDRLKDVILASVNDEKVVEKLLRLPDDATLTDVLKECRDVFASRMKASKLAGGDGVVNRFHTSVGGASLAKPFDYALSLNTSSSSEAQC